MLVELSWFDQHLADRGPMYMETSPGGFIVEPWNAISSLFMLIPAFYWIYRLRITNAQHAIPWIAIILIILGGIGSALFHGFRASIYFLLLDILPSAILTMTLCIYFWIKVLKKWWHLFLILVPLFSSRFIFWGRLPEHESINLSYFITGISVGLPLIIFLIKTKFKDWLIVLIAILSFIIALVFRQIDHVPISFLPMGTHFLWHLFSAVGAYFILDYLYRITHLTSNGKPDGQVPF